MSDLSLRIAANLASIQDRMTCAAERSGRSENAVQLVAVTKYARLEWVQALLSLGQTHLGESRPQQLIERAQTLSARSSGVPDVAWHLIGHLQRNKVRAVLPHVGLIHSVDSLRLARRISEIASDVSLAPRVLLEVNVSGESSKDGFDPDRLRNDWSDLCDLSHLEIAGLMTMAPDNADPESARPTFQALRELRNDLRTVIPNGPALPELSMGMSGDFEIAIEEGATLVRIGSALYDGLNS